MNAEKLGSGNELPESESWHYTLLAGPLWLWNLSVRRPQLHHLYHENDTSTYFTMFLLKLNELIQVRPWKDTCAQYPYIITNILMIVIVIISFTLWAIF